MPRAHLVENLRDKDLLRTLGDAAVLEIASEAANEIERLRVENIQLKFACGYPMPAELEKHIIPANPFRCGICDARNSD
jgi:hypothetical protein